jgi:hypothetical protein
VSHFLDVCGNENDPCIYKVHFRIYMLPASSWQIISLSQFPFVHPSKLLKTRIRKYFSSNMDQLPEIFPSWNEWISLPIRYCDLPLSSQITFTVWDIGGPRKAIPVGGSTFRLFGKKWFVCSLFHPFWIDTRDQDSQEGET